MDTPEEEKPATTSRRTRKRRERPRILCVDDEPFILEGLQANLRRHFDVTTTDNGVDAIQILQTSSPFPIIVSDMRMPEMDGAEFLKRARQISPDSVRILLTGQADLTATIKAVNEGKIFRYVTKPCPVKDLVAVFEAAMNQYRLKTAQRDVLKRTLRGSVEVLTEVLGLVNPRAFGRAVRAQKLVRHIATRLHLPDVWQFELAAMLSQIGCVTLPPEMLDKVNSGYPLSDDEADIYSTHPTIARDLLVKIPRLEEVAEMVGKQNQPLGDQTLHEDIFQETHARVGGHLLLIALTFDQFLGSGLPATEALSKMESTPGQYDPRVLHALRDVEIAETDALPRTVKIADLAAGMRFDQNVETKSGLIVVSKGHTVTYAVIERLRRFSEGVGIVEPIRVRVPQ